MNKIRSLSDLLVPGYKYSSPRFCWALSYYLTLHGKKVKTGDTSVHTSNEIMEAQEMMMDCEVICPALTQDQVRVIADIGKKLAQYGNNKTYFTRISDADYNILHTAGEEWSGGKIMFKNGNYRYILNVDSRDGSHSVVVRKLGL